MGTPTVSLFRSIFAMNSQDTRAAQLFLVHHDYVKGVALKYAPWPGLVEDISQQVFLEFIGKEQRWDLEKDLRPLLATMTRHVAMRLWRERTRERPDTVRKLADHIRLLAEERETPPRYEEELPLLRECLARLPEKSRELVELYYYGDVSTPQIAGRLSMNADTVCRALSRVREKLRECIQRQIQQGGAAHA